MTNRAFVDTNVLVYSAGPSSEKRDRARALLLGVEQPVVSGQVVAEFISVCYRKRILPEEEVKSTVADFLESFDYIPVQERTIQRALDLRGRYALSWWDSLLVAAALDANCDTPYTEDLQHGQVIEGGLRIVNPFVPAP